jgi:S1-C subfamily serine protease
VDGEAVDSARDLQRLMAGEVIGRPVAIRVFRDGQLVTLRATPIELRS